MDDYDYWDESLKAAIHIGLSIYEYNEMTPYELRLHANAFGEKQQREDEEKITMVWMGEFFHRMEKLPSLNEVLGKKEEQTKKAMSPEEMLQKVMQLNSAMNGAVTKAGE